MYAVRTRYQILELKFINSSTTSIQYDLKGKVTNFIISWLNCPLHPLCLPTVISRFTSRQSRVESTRVEGIYVMVKITTDKLNGRSIAAGKLTCFIVIIIVCLIYFLADMYSSVGHLRRNIKNWVSSKTVWKQRYSICIQLSYHYLCSFRCSVGSGCDELLRLGFNFFFW